MRQIGDCLVESRVCSVSHFADQHSHQHCRYKSGGQIQNAQTNRIAKQLGKAIIRKKFPKMRKIIPGIRKNTFNTAADRIILKRNNDTKERGKRKDAQKQDSKPDKDLKLPLPL